MAIDALTPLRIAWIQAFLASVGTKSFSAAARAIGCDQSTVTRDVAHLEKFLGGKVFERGPQLTLTPLGDAFLPKGVAMLELVRDAKVLNKELETTQSRSKSGATPRAVTTWLKNWLGPNSLNDP